MALSLSSIFPIITTTISFLFFVSILEQYRRKRKAHQLVWAVALFLFMITAGAEGFSIIIGEWIPWVYRGYYVLAAVQVSFMGGGVLYLFDSRNVINERNTGKQFLLFGFVWTFFSFLFSQRDNIFFFVFVPAATLVLLGILYQLFAIKDRITAGSKKEYICNFCREEYSEVLDTCKSCSKSAIKPVIPSGRFRSWWHKYISGRFFSNFFLGFSLFIFVLMNTQAWTAPLYESLLTTGKEVSGHPWQQNPELAIQGLEPRAIVRLFSPLFTVPGVITLVGGGFYSYITWQFSIWRNTKSFNLSTGLFNIWIAVGALALGFGGFFSGLGYTLGTIIEFLPPEIAEIGTLYFSEVVSVSMMYWGFLGSDKLSKEKLISYITLGMKSSSSPTP